MYRNKDTCDIMNIIHEFGNMLGNFFISFFT